MARNINTTVDLRSSLKGAIFCSREEGPPNGGAAVVTVTFNTHDGGKRFFDIVERIISGG